MQAQAKDFCLRTDKPPATPQPAAAVIEAWLSDAMVSLPFDQDPGTAERFTELWAKAFKEVRVFAPLAWLAGSPEAVQCRYHGQNGNLQAVRVWPAALAGHPSNLQP